ncbi:MAG TPA: hypothetical protein VM095_09815 [Pyrinomonadaceae bacterium]|nr:hypothetical protein [Pyrinomonadaceae bacterium]
MGTHRGPSAIVAVCFLVAVYVLTLFAHTAQAQQTGPPPVGNRDPFAEIRERQQREAQLRSAEMVGGVKKLDRRSAEAAAEQMREDFKSIQVRRNNLVRHLLAEKPFDFKFIAGEAEEINKRALRLKANLLREVAEDAKKEQEKQVEISDVQMKDALVTMVKRIDSFTENPVFKVPDVVDIQQSAKANRDLQHIILLSDGIRRTADRLNKPHKKP